MKISDLFVSSARQIVRVRRRYRGPIVGTVLGVASLIAMVTLGDVVKKEIGGNLALLGDAGMVKVCLILENYDYPEEECFFTNDDMEALRNIPGVTSVGCAVYSWWPTELTFHATYGRRRFKWVKVIGTDRTFFTLTKHLPIDRGRPFRQSELDKASNVCVIGQDVDDWLFEDQGSPLGKSLLVGGQFLKVVGVLGDTDNGDFQEAILVPITVATKKFAGMKMIRRLNVFTKDIYGIAGIHERVTKIMQSRTDGKAFTASFDKSRIQQLKEIIELFQLFVHVAIVSMLVLAGIGVANVMSATVRERIREIGLRRSVGATDKDITRQFFLESVLVSLMGAVFGIAIGTFMVVVVAGVLDSHIKLEMYALAVLLAFGVGAVSGVGAGVLPAVAAARLDPIVALYHE